MARYDKREVEKRVQSCIDDSIAEGTKKAYARHWGEWTKHCAKESARPLPGEASVLGRFLWLRAEQKESAHVPKQALAAIKHKHVCHGFASPTDDARIGKIMKGIEKKFGKPARQAPPMTEPVITQLMRHHLKQQEGRSRATELRAWRTMVRMRLCHAGLLRFAEVQGLQRRDISIKTEKGQEFLEIKIRKSKTDQVGRGMTRVIPAAEDKSVCPVEMMKNYLQAIKNVPTCPLQQTIVIVDKKTGRAKLSGSNITRSTADRDRVWAIKEAGLASTVPKFTEHSGRRGGAVAIYNAGGEREDVKRAGGWKSDASAERYVEGATKRSLKVAKLVQK